jgi:hypothetical protein
MNSPLHRDELSRRQFVARTASSILGVGLLPYFLQNKASAAPFDSASKLKQVATARNVIYLYMSGGMSHLDTFDPKEAGSAVMGPVKPIASSADGVRVSEYLPSLAKQMHQVAVVTSLASTQGAHEQGNYMMHTSYALRGTIRHPSMGAWLDVLQGGGNGTLPNHVFIGNESRHPGAGFFPAKHTPLFVNNPEGGVSNVNHFKGLTETRFQQRMKLSAELDTDFLTEHPQRNVKAYADMYDSAIKMMKSEDLIAFDLTQESEKMRDGYGRNPFGQGCLLARRLVERGVRFAEVSHGYWDSHNANFVLTPNLCDALDRGLSMLLRDLHARGLLEETLIVLATEFGRTPDINQNVGRDHYPRAFSGLLAGGGIAGGQVYGKTDKEGREIVEGRTEIADFNATIAYALGLSLDQVTFSPSNRPFTVCDKGRPITSLFG